MTLRLILAGDVNLMNVTDATTPFRRVAAELHAADAVFANLECCLHLPSRRSHATEGFFVDPQIGGEALRLSGIRAVGIANNVNYGAENIAASIKRLDQIGLAQEPAPTLPRRVLPPSSPATDCASPLCSEAQCTGRPTTRPLPIRPVSP
jgi:poly-gamma-glutamate synthesis protein (capsule biosynthesis protein)